MGIVRKTAIIVPCYNEERRLDSGEFLRFVSANDGVFFIFVNDGSTDGTGALLARLASGAPGRVQAMDLAVNSGKAEAVRQGFLMAFEQGFDAVGFWDADLATPLECVPEFVSMIDAGKDVVLGSRVRLLGRQIQRRAGRHYLGRIFATAVSALLRLPVYDTQCGAKLFRRTAELEAAMAAPFGVRWTFDVELLARLSILADAKGLPSREESWVEFPLKRWEEVRGSKVGPKDFLRSGGELLKLVLFFRSAASRGRYMSRLLAAKGAPSGQARIHGQD